MKNKRGPLQQQYLLKKNLGGLFGKDPNENIDTSRINMLGSMASGFVNAVDPGDQYGVQSDATSLVSGVASGAAAGAVGGPVGMGVGAVIGGVTSLAGNNKRKQMKEQTILDKTKAYNENADLEVYSKLALDPRLSGDPNAQMYKMGGTIKGQPAGKFALKGTLVGNYKAMQSLMPDISIRPNRMMQDGGKIYNVSSSFNSLGLGNQKAPEPIKGKISTTSNKKTSSTSQTKASTPSLSSKEIESRRNAIYNPVRNKLNEVLTDVEGIDPNIQDILATYDMFPSEKRTNVFGSKLNNPPPMSDKIKDLQSKINKMPADVIRDLLRTDWRGLSEKQAIDKAKSAGIGYLDMVKYGPYFKDLIKKGHTFKNGGILPVDLEGRAVVEGPSHAEGGVKIPEIGVELEGDETLAGNFVFSKDLGFADKHKKIMKAMGKTRKDDTLLANYTRAQLEKKEEMLKVQQESLKQSMGQENEIDNTAEEMSTMNRTLPFKDLKGLKKKRTGGKLLDDRSLLDTGKMGDDLVSKYLADQNSAVAPAAPIVGSTETTGTEGQKNSLWGTVEKAAPFATNLVNNFRKLPATPDPILNNSIAPRYQNYSGSRAEVVRGVRGANKTAAQQLASGNATAATTAANLVGGLRALNEVNQAENNVNAAIGNRTAEQNLQISRENNAKMEYKNIQDVSRELRQQELNSENLADVGNKIQLQMRDRNLRSLEDDKMMLTIAQDNTGASWRAGRDIFKRRLSAESFKALDERMKGIEEMSKQERELTLQALRSSLSSLGGNQSTLVKDNNKKKK